MACLTNFLICPRDDKRLSMTLLCTDARGDSALDSSRDSNADISADIKFEVFS